MARTIHGFDWLDICQRLMAEAIVADYIVVGRPIYEAPDPVAAIAEIREQLRVSS